ncbi:MAG: DNRLRE domain-containing protein, partial [archaeon]
MGKSVKVLDFRKCLKMFWKYNLFVVFLAALLLLNFANVEATSVKLNISGPGDADSYVSGVFGDHEQNFGTDKTVNVHDLKRIYLKFNISEIPDNQQIDYSQVCMYVITKKVQTINVYSVYSDWDELTLTWNNQPCGIAFDNSTACNLTLESSVNVNESYQNTWRCWNSTNIVQEAYDNREFVSMIFNTSDSSETNEFNSRDSPDSELYPYLNISYSVIANPEVQITYPLNQNYSEIVSSLEYTVSGASLDSCWYSLDSGVTNESTICGVAITSLPSEEGWNNWTVWANNSAGGENSSLVSFFVDSIAPTISIISPENITYTNATVLLNISSDGDNVWYSWNGTNESYTSPVEVNFSEGYNTLYAYANDTFGNENSSSVTFLVDTSLHFFIINSNYTLVNGTIKTPEFGDNFSVQVNLNSSAEIDYVNFTIRSPNGDEILKDLNGSFVLDGGNYVWDSDVVEVDNYGTWNWSYVSYNGESFVSDNGSFRIESDAYLFPEVYSATPDPKNETLMWNLSLYHLSYEYYNFSFSYNLNETFFNLTFEDDYAQFNRQEYNRTNVYKNQITIEISEDVLEGVNYEGNITITRLYDSEEFVVPLSIGIQTPSGNIDAFDLFGVRCSGSNCDVDESMENDESVTFSWILKNTGGNNLSECMPSVIGFDIASFGSFSISNFSLEIDESSQISLEIANPPVNSYYGRLEVVCKATESGYENSLGSDSGNSPSISLTVSADSGESPSSPGGGSSGSGSNSYVVGGGLAKLEVSPIKSIVSKGEEKNLLASVKNIGGVAANKCRLVANEGYEKFIESDNLKNIG